MFIVHNTLYKRQVALELEQSGMEPPSPAAQGPRAQGSRGGLGCLRCLARLAGAHGGCRLLWLQRGKRETHRVASSTRRATHLLQVCEGHGVTGQDLVWLVRQRGQQWELLPVREAAAQHGKPGAGGEEGERDGVSQRVARGSRRAPTAWVTSSPCPQGQLTCSSSCSLPPTVGASWTLRAARSSRLRGWARSSGWAAGLSTGGPWVTTAIQPKGIMAK